MKREKINHPALRPDLPHDTPVDPINAAKTLIEPTAVPSDVLGSYTGLTADGEHPEQDADDL